MTGSYDVIFNFLVIIRSEALQIPVFGQIEYKTFSKYSKLLVNIVNFCLTLQQQKKEI